MNMNQSVFGWSNPPPPGTEVSIEEQPSASTVIKSESDEQAFSKTRDNGISYDSQKHVSSRDRSYHRRRSSSRSRRKKHKESNRRHRSRSRSRSRGHRRRSRSRARHRHRNRSSTRSRSRSRTRHGRSKKSKRHRKSNSKTHRSSRSYSRSRSHSRSRKSSYHTKLKIEAEEWNDTHSNSDRDDRFNTSGEIEDDAITKENAFKNDGSFLEMFKKMQEQQKAEEAAKIEATTSDTKKAFPSFGKRRGGRILKTGLVEKTKMIEEPSESSGLDAWSVYMKEVKRYKEACCDDDSKTRPLVK